MKRILLPLSCVFMMTLTAYGQRISSFTIVGKTACGPSAAFNPTNQDANKPGDLQIVFPTGTDLSNVTPVFGCGDGFEVSQPSPMVTDFTSTVSGIRVTSTAAPTTSWADYKVTCKVINPTTLPFSVFGTDATSTDSWTSSTLGWAAARIDKSYNYARFGGSNSNLVIAYTDNNPSEVTTLTYQINAASTDFGASNTFDVHESPNGTDWTLVVTYTNTNIPKSTATAAEKTRSHTLLPTTRYVRWLYSNRTTNVNASVQAISIQKGVPSGITSMDMPAIKAVVSGDQLMINAPESITCLQIVSVNGQTIKTLLQPQNLIDISDLPEGCYFVRCSLSSNQNSVARFVK